MARILLGVTGGIAAYKACTLLRLLVKAGHDVYPIVTTGAERFVAAETFFALARKSRSDDPYPHLERADLLVVAPATANTLARLAHGLADDLLTEAALAHEGALVLAPAMNVRMWRHAATQANVALLQDRGASLVGPAEGELAEGEVGIGRMAEPEEIAARVEELLSDRSERSGSPLQGRSVLVSAGGTREPLDSVRFLGNRSSGRMGVALAREARRRGAEVTLVAANLSVPAPPGVTVIDAPTAADVEREALARADADVVVMAAAVADYRPATPLADKRSKDGNAWSVELEPTADVLAEIGRRRRAGQVIVGFAADGADNGLERAREKLSAKGADLFVFNDVSRADIGFDVDENEVVLLSNGGERVVEKSPKSRIAEAVLDEVERLLSSR
ncbi:MAG TPA: bifunctional phosphopantothenoylcysteine decarboxylase/phosphopantothenate--cysteine ligase CoaBC [Gaiellaceae bacterium]|nr:bifunctional phosphopantothenoylcysteine decarboxylase/phosphopantothenate--cysteine ligase CoaBC [Gaiellaceae bacterium]